MEIKSQETRENEKFFRFLPRQQTMRFFSWKRSSLQRELLSFKKASASKADLIQSLSRLNTQTKREAPQANRKGLIFYEKLYGKIIFYSTSRMHFSNVSSIQIIDKVELRMLTKVNLKLYDLINFLKKKLKSLSFAKSSLNFSMLSREKIISIYIGSTSRPIKPLHRIPWGILHSRI